MLNHNVLPADLSLPPTGGRLRWATANVLALGLHGALLLGLGYHLAPPLLPAAQPMVLMMVAEQAESTPNAEPMPTGVRQVQAVAQRQANREPEAAMPPLIHAPRATERQSKAKGQRNDPIRPKTEPPRPRQEEQEKIASASSIASSTSAPPSLDGKRVAAPQTSVASQPSQDASVWSGLLLAHLSRFKRYPALAVRQQRQGIVQVAVTLDRQGNVLGVKLLRSSGVASLDREALQLPQRASPLPAPGNEIAAGQAEFSVNIPIRFDLREVRR